MESLSHVLADLSSPLNNLLKKAVQWNCSEECQESFEKIKETLTSTEVLAHYNPDVPLGLACDASGVGIGAVIYHKYEAGTERPIAYASKTLSDAERKYSQIEREALSIIFRVKKFHQFLYGRTFSLLTDHKPLITIFTIFSPEKGIPTLVPVASKGGPLFCQHIRTRLNTSPQKSMEMLIAFLGYPLDLIPILRRLRV